MHGPMNVKFLNSVPSCPRYVPSSVICGMIYENIWLKPYTVWKIINLLKPTGHVMHHQFNIQQLYALPTLYLCVLYLSENKQRLMPLKA